MDGTGGTYFFKDVFHRNTCCFKPKDEEPFGPNNPRGLVGQLGQSGLRKGILSGEACERELAAYLLDKVLFHCLIHMPRLTLDVESLFRRSCDLFSRGSTPCFQI